VAYSGGVDSAVLLKVSYDILAENTLAVTSDSPSVPRSELEEAKKIAHEIGVRHLIIQTDEVTDANYFQNPADRCYFCKQELYSKLKQISEREKIPYIANGINMDDLGDYRPGLQAAAELKVVSPLREANFTKQDVRNLAKMLGLKIWDKPASPCLSSRIPYGRRVTVEKLSVIEKAEEFIKSLNIREVRVRHFDEMAKIETTQDDFYIIKNHFYEIEEQFKSFGFEKIEWAEFKSGSLNRLIQLR